MTDQEQQILTAYAQGVSVDLIAVNEAMSKHVIVSVLERLCRMDRAVARRMHADANRPTPPPVVPQKLAPLAPAPPPPEPTRDGIETLLRQAEAHPSPVVRRHAEKVRTILATIADAIKADQRQAELRQRLAAAEDELNAARAALGLAPKRSTPALDREETATIRNWAAENGIEVGAVGRLPKTAVDAYRKAVTS